MGRSAIISLFLLASFRFEALSSECAGAGIVLRAECPRETLVDCDYDESQCDILNV